MKAMNSFNGPITRWMVLVLCAALALPFSVLPVAAQEPGEPVELALPAPMGSLKIVPIMQELVQMLENPYVEPTRRPSFLAQPLPPLLIQPMSLNPPRFPGTFRPWTIRRFPSWHH